MASRVYCIDPFKRNTNMGQYFSTSKVNVTFGLRVHTKYRSDSRTCSFGKYKSNTDSREYEPEVKLSDLRNCV